MVLTVDEALYCKLIMMLKWSTAAYQGFLIYKKIFGQHMNTAKNVMAGKDFPKAVICAHEITS